MAVRAKMRCYSKEGATSGEPGSGGTVRFYPVVSGSAENESFYRYTPGGSLVLGTINQAAFDQFAVGNEYYVDISEATA